MLQASSRSLIYEYINTNQGTKVKELSFASKFINSFISSSIVLFVSYPFELASTRMSGDMTRFGHKRIHVSLPDLFSKLTYEGKN